MPRNPNKEDETIAIAVLKEQFKQLSDSMKAGFGQIDERIISYANDTKQRYDVINNNQIEHEERDEATRNDVAEIKNGLKTIKYILMAVALTTAIITKSPDKAWSLIKLIF